LNYIPRLQQYYLGLKRILRSSLLPCAYAENRNCSENVSYASISKWNNIYIYRERERDFDLYLPRIKIIYSLCIIYEHVVFSHPPCTADRNVWRATIRFYRVTIITLWRYAMVAVPVVCVSVLFGGGTRYRIYIYI